MIANQVLSTRDISSVVWLTSVNIYSTTDFPEAIGKENIVIFEASSASPAANYYLTYAYYVNGSGRAEYYLDGSYKTKAITWDKATGTINSLNALKGICHIVAW